MTPTVHLWFCSQGMWLISKRASGLASRVVLELAWTPSTSICSNHTSCLEKKRTTRCSMLRMRAYRTTWGEGEFCSAWKHLALLSKTVERIVRIVTYCKTLSGFSRREFCNEGEGDPPLYVNVNMFSGEIMNTWIDSLQAFFPGLQVRFCTFVATGDGVCVSLGWCHYCVSCCRCWMGT